MASEKAGSTWKKWDLHVHTPESIVNNYPGDKEAAWASFLDDLEKLPPEFKCIGINDYVFIDGYRRVLKEKRENGRLANIDLLLPVVEFRIDKFSGVVQKEAEGYRASSWARVNVHIIFDELDPDLIRDQFLAAITRNYKLTPEAEEKKLNWGGVITRENLAELGRKIIESVPEEKRAAYGSPLTEGFNNLNFSMGTLIEALENPLLKGHALIAIGKTEWESLKWDDHNIAEKKSLINTADIVFTAAENPEKYAKGRVALDRSGVNAKLLDCSDAHWLSTADDKDRIGNCFTWIKADSTFAGLVQAIEEFDSRVFVGDLPPKLQLIDRNRTKYISSIHIKPKDGAPHSWFDSDIPLNADLVAIIGNKGSGKSALSDIVALVGDTRNYDSFSFLRSSRFREPKARLAQHYQAALKWAAGDDSVQNLDKDPSNTSVERVKYLPQNYLETLCNELGAGGSRTFDTELRKIIYSHVPVDQRLGRASMDDLLSFKVTAINDARGATMSQISALNERLLEVDRQLAPGYREGLEELKKRREAELLSLENSKPQPVEDPNTSANALAASKSAVEQLEKLEQQVREVEREEILLFDKKAEAAKLGAQASRILLGIQQYAKSFLNFQDELTEQLRGIGTNIQASDLVNLHVDGSPLELLIESSMNEIQAADQKLVDPGDGGLRQRRSAIESSIAEMRGQLDERQRQYVLYRESVAQWEQLKAQIIGNADAVDSIEWIKAQLAAVEQLPAARAQLRERRDELTRAAFDLVKEMANEYQRLYQPVQAFVQSTEQLDINLPLSFQVKIEVGNFQDMFLSYLNRQARGSFSGVEESANQIKTLLQLSSFDDREGVLTFAQTLEEMLRIDKRDDLGRETKLSDQLRKGIEPLDVLDYIYGLGYLEPRYSLTFAGQEIGQLSPGERGLLLLVFYLLVDKDDIPIVIDQPEENLDNQTIYRILVKCVKKAKERRQVIMVTHNPNLAVVCDAEQIIYAACDKVAGRFTYVSGAIENPDIRNIVVEILEGTEPAFKNRQTKYRLS